MKTPLVNQCDLWYTVNILMILKPFRALGLERLFYHAITKITIEIYPRLMYTNTD